jgi:hypothetical protein
LDAKSAKKSKERKAWKELPRAIPVQSYFDLILLLLLHLEKERCCNANPNSIPTISSTKKR